MLTCGEQFATRALEGFLIDTPANVPEVGGGVTVPVIVIIRLEKDAETVNVYGNTAVVVRETVAVLPPACVCVVVCVIVCMIVVGRVVVCAMVAVFPPICVCVVFCMIVVGRVMTCFWVTDWVTVVGSIVVTVAVKLVVAVSTWVTFLAWVTVVAW
jgi:hypothetical protein